MRLFRTETEEIPKPGTSGIPQRYGKDGKPLRCVMSEQLRYERDRDWHNYWLTKKLR